MKKLLLIFILIPNICFAGILVKYNKTTGDIIQINDGLKEIPSQEILNDRFISDITDVIFIEDKSIDIEKNRVDIDKKKIINIPKEELDAKKQVIDQQKAKKEQDKISAENKLKILGLTQDEIDTILN